MFNPVSYLFYFTSAQLGKAGVIDQHRGKRIADLAWPRFLTMFARYLYRVADIAMVGLAVGPAAIAGLAFASIYWGLSNAFSLGIAAGNISQVSQRFGAESYDRLDLAVKQSVWIGLAIATVFVSAYWFFSEPLIALVGDDPQTIALGATYLKFLALGFFFNVLNLISSRTLAGCDDTWIAMSLRATGAFLNIILNAILIFGLGLGVQGAAIGTVIAEGTITAFFAWGMITGSLPIIGPFPVTISVTRPYFDYRLTKQLLKITPPLIARHLARSFARFPLFAILALFGPTIVAAFEVGRRMRKLIGATGNGFSMSAAGVVGQELGRGDEPEADRYAGDVIRFSAFIYVITAIIVLVFARPLAGFFAEDPTVIAETVPFIRVAAISFVAMAMGRSYFGILKAAGDTTWIFYASLIAQYAALIPITYLGLITPLGVTAVYIAMIAESSVEAGIAGYRVFSGKWKVVSRVHRPSATSD